MDWKQFLKPNWKKIALFVMLYVLIPYPLGLWELPTETGKIGLKNFLSNFFSPLVLKDSIEISKYGLEGYTNVYLALFFLSFPFIWLIIVYFLSCWIVARREKRSK